MNIYRTTYCGLVDESLDKNMTLNEYSVGIKLERK